ncbi:hypothetical protein JCM3263A_09410 [Thermobifida fusca]|uniref:SPOR domain-containing protein n=2 Tax=Thermobifida fusca TaxID=2021 RepID=A0A9P2TCW8_THEFU|nr:MULTISPECIES: hypothetical protein [Thermobifida]AAZ55007.1 hypothetical protein Tfu_0969 [Thermobifida fusca YX]EOR71976.1 hypothetical protein TM51_05237 [Thermobifida fusca TM51]MBO2528343.1 hypothetical protein [Thermobifida sp.]PPS92598.1 oxidoreductase [Thermobifida fusca]PZN65079.1 MAG: hypothetical protein DIU53_04540 [Thermobifida fusca]
MFGKRRRDVLPTPEDGEDKWWYSLKTGKVERGPGSPTKDRLGPYPDRASAEAALERARQRNEQWEEEDREWNEW